MIDAIVKIAGSLFIGGLGMAMIFVFSLLMVILALEVYGMVKRRYDAK
jgi:hypothetical protein